MRALHILSVKYNRRLSSGVIASVVCADQLREGRSIEPDWNGFFLAKEQAQESCYSIAEIYGELSCLGTPKRSYTSVLTLFMYINRLQTQRIALEPNTKTYFTLTNLQIASLCSALRVSENPRTGSDWTRVELLWFPHTLASTKFIHT